MKDILRCFIVLLLLLLLLSCIDPSEKHEIKGDPKIVEEFNFAKAWSEAKPTIGEIVELREDVVSGYSYLYANVTFEIPGKGGSYRYRDGLGPGEYKVFINERGIINDLGDTIYQGGGDNGSTNSKVIYHIGKTKIFSFSRSYGAESFEYLIQIDSVDYNLMKTMRSTYNSIKYLQTIFPDSLIPFDIFDNERTYESQ